MEGGSRGWMAAREYQCRSAISGSTSLAASVLMTSGCSEGTANGYARCKPGPKGYLQWSAVKEVVV